jgi:hypothetical protein
MPQANQWHRAGEHGWGLRCAKALRGPSLRHLLIRFPLACQTENLGCELAKIAQVNAAADGTRPRQCADGPATPDHPGGHHIGRTPLQHDFVEQTPPAGLALDTTERVLEP